MANNDWFAQFLADVLNVAVERPASAETTALGAAYLAGLTIGLWPDTGAIAARWQAAARFEPRMEAVTRQRLLGGWRDALETALAGLRPSKAG
jgi:glycerol kinase